MTKNKIAIFILLLFLHMSCKKHTNPAPTCNTTLYGYKGTFDLTGAFSSQTFGIIDPVTATISPVATFPSSVYSNQGAFNASNGNYYVFQYYNTGMTSQLFQVNVGSGIVTPISVGASADHEGLVFNGANNTCYYIAAGSPASVFGFTFPGGVYTVSAGASAGGNATSVSPVSSTMDNATGTMYYELSDLASSPYAYYIGKSVNGGAGITVVSGAGTDARILGLRFNKNDNMLYAIRENNISSSSTTFDFIKINPSTGAIATISSSLSFTVNNEFYSAAIDPCGNRYLVCVLTDFTSGAGTFYQLKISDGSIVQTNAVAQPFQGLVESNQ